jgi:hypothetical protein
MRRSAPRRMLPSPRSNRLTQASLNPLTYNHNTKRTMIAPVEYQGPCDRGRGRSWRTIRIRFERSEF